MRSRRHRFAGQAMIEYIVVVTALVTALVAIRVDLDDGRGPISVVEWLTGVMKANQRGYAHSISAIQEYGDFPVAAAPTTGATPPTTVYPEVPGVNFPDFDPPGAGPLLADTIGRATVVTGNSRIGTTDSDGNIYDFDGNLIGTTDDEGTIEWENGDSDLDYDEYDIHVAVIDSDGNDVEPSAVVRGDKLLGFAYVSDDGIFVDPGGVSTGSFTPVNLKPNAKIAELDDIFDGFVHAAVSYRGLIYDDLTVAVTGYDPKNETEASHDYEIVWVETRTIDSETGALVKYEGTCGAKLPNWQDDDTQVQSLLTSDDGSVEDPDDEDVSLATIEHGFIKGLTIGPPASIFRNFGQQTPISTTSKSASTIASKQAECGPRQVVTIDSTRTQEKDADGEVLSTSFSAGELRDPPAVDYEF